MLMRDNLPKMPKLALAVMYVTAHLLRASGCQGGDGSRYVPTQHNGLRTFAICPTVSLRAQS